MRLLLAGIINGILKLSLNGILKSLLNGMGWSKGDDDMGEIQIIEAMSKYGDKSAFDFGASRIFLNDDTAGTCDDTAPAESGDQIQIVGTAIHADILFFNPSVDVGEI
jgi:hypothetical protein